MPSIDWLTVSHPSGDENRLTIESTRRLCQRFWRPRIAEAELRRELDENGPMKTPEIETRFNSEVSVSEVDKNTNIL
jgi:hypothetical protein